MKLDLKIRLLILLYIIVIFYIGGVVVEIAFFFKNLFSPVKIQFEPNFHPLTAYGAWLFLDFNCTLFGLFIVFLISTFVTGFLYNHKRGIPEFKTIKRNGQEINVVTNDTSVATGHPAWVEDIEKYFIVTSNPKKYNEPVYGKLEDGRFIVAREPKYDDEGFLFLDAKNIELVNYYRDKFGAVLLGIPHPYRMFIDEASAQKLLKIYTLKGE